MSKTRVFTKEDLNEEKCKRLKISCPIAVRRVLQSMYGTSIWCNEKFVLILTSEALIYASRFLPFVFIKGKSTNYLFRINFNMDILFYFIF